MMLMQMRLRTTPNWFWPTVGWARQALMEAAKSCSLGSISHALYAVGGEYRRNM